MGGEFRDQAVQALHGLVSDLAGDPGDAAERTLALQALASLDPAAYRASAARAALLALEDPAVRAGQRRRIAEGLAGSGRQHEHAALLALRAIVTDTTVDAQTRFDAVSALGRMAEAGDRVKAPVPQWIHPYT
jgi:hypothetical protein